MPAMWSSTLTMEVRFFGGGYPGDTRIHPTLVSHTNHPRTRSPTASLVPGQNSQLNEFFGDIEIVKKAINMIKTATLKIGDIQQQVVLATTNEKEAEESKDLEAVIMHTNKSAQVAKGILTKLKENTERMKADAKAKATDIRIRENLVNTLTRKFIDVMKEYQNAQNKYKTEIKKKVKRQVQIVKPDASPEEIDAVLKSGRGADEVFKQAILQGEAADSIRNMYMNVQGKYQDVLALEASVAEVHQMFLDLALLTEQQGELLDQIETQVKAASDYIEEGNTELTKAIEIQKSIRQKQCCIIVIVLVIIAVVVGAVVGSQQAKAKLGI